MLRSLFYVLSIYFVLLGMLAYAHVDRFFYWIEVCSAAIFVGAFIGNMFGEIDLRKQQDDLY